MFLTDNDTKRLAASCTYYDRERTSSARYILVVMLEVIKRKYDLKFDDETFESYVEHNSQFIEGPN